jgi:hypothetical protein
LGKSSDQCSVIRCQRQVIDARQLRRKKDAVTITLNHFSAALVFAVFASIVFGITHRETTREMIRYGLYCFAMFVGGVIVAGWAMWLLRR